MSTIIRFQSSYADPYPLQIVGEQSYREEIEDVTGYTGEDEGINSDDFWAHLKLEDNNPHDRGNAVAVEIEYKTVGYLSKSDAKKYRAKLKELGLSDVVGECYASIKGGFIKRSGEQADFGVRLDINLDTLNVQTSPKVKSAKVISPPMQGAQSQRAPSQPIHKEAPSKITFIPMKGKGLLYYLFILPIVASINFMILVFAGIGFGIKWIVDRSSNFNSPRP